MIVGDMYTLTFYKLYFGSAMMFQGRKSKRTSEDQIALN